MTDYPGFTNQGPHGHQFQNGLFAPPFYGQHVQASPPMANFQCGQQPYVPYYPYYQPVIQTPVQQPFQGHRYGPTSNPMIFSPSQESQTSGLSPMTTSNTSRSNTSHSQTHQTSSMLSPSTSTQCNEDVDLMTFPHDCPPTSTQCNDSGLSNVFEDQSPQLHTSTGVPHSVVDKLSLMPASQLSSSEIDQNDGQDSSTNSHLYEAIDKLHSKVEMLENKLAEANDQLMKDKSVADSLVLELEEERKKSFKLSSSNDSLKNEINILKENQIQDHDTISDLLYEKRQLEFTLDIEKGNSYSLSKISQAKVSDSKKVMVDVSSQFDKSDMTKTYSSDTSTCVRVSESLLLDYSNELRELEHDSDTYVRVSESLLLDYSNKLRKLEHDLIKEKEFSSNLAKLSIDSIPTACKGIQVNCNPISIDTSTSSQCDHLPTVDIGSQCDDKLLTSITNSSKVSGTQMLDKMSQCKSVHKANKSVQCTPANHCSQCDILELAGLGSQCTQCHWRAMGVQLTRNDLLLIENITLSRIVDVVYRRVIGYSQQPRNKAKKNKHCVNLPCLMEIKTRVPPPSFGPLPYYAQVRPDRQ